VPIYIKFHYFDVLENQKRQDEEFGLSLCSKIGALVASKGRTEFRNLMRRKTLKQTSLRFRSCVQHEYIYKDIRFLHEVCTAVCNTRSQCTLLGYEKRDAWCTWNSSNSYSLSRLRNRVIWYTSRVIVKCKTLHGLRPRRITEPRSRL